MASLTITTARMRSGTSWSRSKRLGWTADGIIDLLERHPEGIAKKYEGRLCQEVERAYDKMDALIARAQDCQSEGGADMPAEIDKPPPPLVYVDMSKWINAPVPQRRWTVLNRIPAKNVTVLSGTGGTGKTIIAMQLAVAIVLGLDWFRALSERGPVIFLSGEEDAEEMHRRFADITEHLGVSYQDLIDGGLHLIDKAGRNAMLARRDEAIAKLKEKPKSARSSAPTRR